MNPFLNSGKLLAYSSHSALSWCRSAYSYEVTYGGLVTISVTELFFKFILRASTLSTIHSICLCPTSLKNSSFFFTMRRTCVAKVLYASAIILSLSIVGFTDFISHLEQSFKILEKPHSKKSLILGSLTALILESIIARSCFC